MKLIDIVQLTDSEFLNMYKLELVNKKGKLKDYYVASRRKKDDLTCVTGKHETCDGVMILPITENDEVILVRQYRPAIGDFLYELPAGMIDKGEDIETAAKRELFEETGLKASSYELLIKPSYSSVGMSDETTAVVKMTVYGEPSTDNLEDDEELEIIKIKKSEAKEFVKNNNISIKAALILNFISSDS